MEAELIPGLPDDVALQCLLRLPFYSITVARGVCRRWKHELASSSFYRLRKAAGLARPVIALLLQSKFLSLADRWRLALFEPATGAWTMRRLIADSPHATRYCEHVVVVGRELVLVDWWDDSVRRFTGQVSIYDLVTGDWRQGAPMPPPLRFSYSCVAGPRTVFVSGGRDATNKNLLSALAYDPATDAWVQFDAATQWPWRAAHIAAYEERMMYPCQAINKGEKLEALTWYDSDVASLWRSSGLHDFPEYSRSFFAFQF